MKFIIYSFLVAVLLFAASTCLSKRLFVDSFVYGYPYCVYDTNVSGGPGQDSRFYPRSAAKNFGMCALVAMVVVAILKPSKPQHPPHHDL